MIYRIMYNIIIYLTIYISFFKPLYAYYYSMGTMYACLYLYRLKQMIIHFVFLLLIIAIIIIIINSIYCCVYK